MTNEFGGQTTIVAQSYDWSETVPSTAVAETVAEAVNEAPTEIPPLYESIDTDALDSIIRSNGHQPRGQHRCISFSYAKLWVTIDGSGMVSVNPP